MYNDYFGFRENPFNLTPDSSFFFPSEKHKSALDALVYAIQERKGFVVITGEVGSGKTTVSRTLLKRLGPNIKTAVINNTFISPKGVITLLLEDLGIEYKHGPKERLLIQLNDYLISQAKHDCDIVLLIDEAQNLSMQCLEEIRMLSNLETEKEKLIQIIMLGQPELRRKLESPRLEQLRQRVAVQFHLEPLNPEEVRAYILHRLNYAKSNGRPLDGLFDDEALNLVSRYSQGIPRLVNKLCDHALLGAFVAESQVVTSVMMKDAIEDFYIREDKSYEQIYQSA
ncbi:MAG: AAA family ATPase [Candidatus Omnitrophica bacterium]|nr:AAA family ATPase [Candidatus Omnitrophota bacterium]MDD5672174.1 AAA family ATPase [Candidatus Omnitrophota bacterium]